MRKKLKIKTTFIAICAFISVFSCNVGHRSESNGSCATGLEQYESKNYTASFDNYNKAIQLDSTNALGWEGRGSCEYKLKDYNTALVDEFHALRLDSTLKNVRYWIGVIKYDMKDYSSSLAYYEMSIAISGDNTALDYEGKGACEYNLGQYDKAVEDETKAITLDSTLVNTYDYLGLIKAERGNDAGAITDYRHSIRLANNMDCAAQYAGLAMSEYHVGDNENALKDINAAIAMDSTQENIYNQRGLIRGVMKNYQGSLEDFNHAIAVQKDAHDGKNYEGKAVAEYNLGNYADAMNDIVKAMQIDSTLKNAEVWKEEIAKKIK